MRTNHKWMRVLKLGVIMCLAWIFAFSFHADAKAASKITGLKQLVGSDNTVIISWTPYKATGTVKYEIYKDGKMVDFVYSPNDRCAITGLKAGQSYKVQVAAYQYKKGKSSKLLAKSNVVQCTTAPTTKPKNLKEVSTTTNSITASWSKVKDANLYKVVYRERNMPVSSAKCITVTTNKATIKNLKANARYSINVYPVRKSSSGFLAVDDATYANLYISVTPAKVTGVQLRDYWRNTNKINIHCDTVETISGYEAETWTAYNVKSTKVALTGSASGNAIIINSKQFEKANFYKVRVRANVYNATKTKKKYGAWSDWTYVAPQPKVRMTSNSKGMQISYEKINGANRYDIYVSTSEKSGYTKVASTSKTTYAFTKFKGKNLKKGTTYYVYVVPSKLVDKVYYAGNNQAFVKHYSAKYK